MLVRSTNDWCISSSVILHFTLSCPSCFLDASLHRPPVIDLPERFPLPLSLSRSTCPLPLRHPPAIQSTPHSSSLTFTKDRAPPLRWWCPQHPHLPSPPPRQRGPGPLRGCPCGAAGGPPGSSPTPGPRAGRGQALFLDPPPPPPGGWSRRGRRSPAAPRRCRARCGGPRRRRWGTTPKTCRWTWAARRSWRCGKPKSGNDGGPERPLPGGGGHDTREAAPERRVGRPEAWEDRQSPRQPPSAQGRAPGTLRGGRRAPSSPAASSGTALCTPLSGSVCLGWKQQLFPPRDGDAWNMTRL